MLLKIDNYGEVNITNIPTTYASVEECRTKKAFIKANFMQATFGDVEAIICDPDNAIAFCQLVYDFMIKNPRRKALDELDPENPPFDWCVNESWEPSKWLESCDEAGIINALIQHGIVLTSPKGEKHGPYPVDTYYSNDYLVLPDYQKYLREGFNLDEIDTLLDEYAKDYVLDVFISAGMGWSLIADPVSKKCIKYDWFEKVSTEDLDEALHIVVDQTDEYEDWGNDPEDVAKCVKAVAQYLSKRGENINPKEMADTFLANTEG